MRITAKRSSVVLCVATLFVVSLASASCWAQAQPFSHIVVIFQENRTPDNLFGAAVASQACAGQDDFEPGVDIQNWGYINGTNHQCFVSRPLSDLTNPGHSHGDFSAMYHGGAMDGCSHGTDCYSLVPKAGVQPYFDIATTYSFANYMFQTNEGPSFEAHQFIFAGTSAPVGHTDQTYFDWFALNNPANFFNNAGCSSMDTQNNEDFVNGIKWDGSTKDGSSQHPWYIPPGPPPLTYSYPCYEHRTLADLLDDHGISWKYYAPKEGSIWTAPTAIQHICGTVDTHPCPNFQLGGQYANKVIFEHDTVTAPIFNDIDSCTLAAVSWVIPDFKWSDHPAGVQNGTGPDYVGDIVDRIGEGSCGYWNNTAILITWDDWGGWQDHVNPANAPGLSVKLSCPVSSWGCGNTYGFRVPLLVVSRWTGIHNQDGTYSGYISGNTITQHEVFPYIHDFGSILAYIEYNFLGAGQIGKINFQNNYLFADGRAPDGANGNIPLLDFFGLASPRPFVHINTSHPETYFNNNPAGPEGPGDDGDPD
jgi:phospholipase C